MAQAGLSIDTPLMIEVEPDIIDIASESDSEDNCDDDEVEIDEDRVSEDPRAFLYVADFLLNREPEDDLTTDSEEMDMGSEGTENVLDTVSLLKSCNYRCTDLDLD